MRSLPMSLARAALAHGLEVHNYYRPPMYVEVFLPATVVGCMLRGTSKEVTAFVEAFEAGSLGITNRQALAACMQVHHLGKLPKVGATMAVCFPDWQFEPEGDA
jgi:hypothetical protein